MLNRLKQQIRIIESILTEGDHWPEDYRRKAINRIRLATDALKYSDADIERDVDEMFTKFTPLSHKNSNLGYFLPIIRMFIGYAGNDTNKRKEFINKKFDNIVKTLQLISSDPSLELKFKEDIKKRWTLDDFEKHAAEIQAEIDKADADSLASATNSDSSDYDVILIESYEELNEKFGGDKTGYKGQSEWCHTNGQSTYDSWTEKGTKQFFVLAKKGWENIQPPDPKTTNAFDDYGTSLIAILVKVENCELLNATLRWNHVILPSITVPKTSADHAFLGWGDLSKAVGFNVKAVVEKELKDFQDDLENRIEKANKEIYDKLKTVTEITENTIPLKYKQLLTHLEIPDNVTSIGKWAFEDCHGLENVTIGNGVKSIGWGAFSDCWKLSSVTIPNSVTWIGRNAFSYCNGLTSVTIPDSVTSIGDGAFYGCSGLTSVTVEKGVTVIGASMFTGCDRLISITIPDSVTSIGKDAFARCYGLKTVAFEGKTLDEIKAMAGYPWKIKDPENVITVEAGND